MHYLNITESKLASTHAPKMLQFIYETTIFQNKFFMWRTKSKETMYTWCDYVTDIFMQALVDFHRYYTDD